MAPLAQIAGIQSLRAFAALLVVCTKCYGWPTNIASFNLKPQYLISPFFYRSATTLNTMRSASNVKTANQKDASLTRPLQRLYSPR